MFRSLLIANRGEIACRVIRTARSLGIRTIAVYSQADAHAMHVALADEAHAIGPAPAADSYLRADRIIEVARRAGAQAVHPGYGFLSENAAFAEACAAAGIVFVGPPAGAIRAMGLKDAAKALMEKAGVPVVPGYHGDNQDAEFLGARAGEIGYPVLIKAVAGGGGKGMRRVDGADGFAKALAAAQREAKSAFGDTRVLVEKYVSRPRHIEIQVFADGQGQAVSLFERDCSVQRRHQKVAEEAPAPGMPPAMRAAMGEAAVAAAKAVGYVGAGTVEFIADASEGLKTDRFYFMEMNTRLQVEHPVTEAITGLDLVEWQLRVAAGEPLPLTQGDLAIKGHAVEARLYAEDPHKNFFPSPGILHHLKLPAPGRHVRIDTGVRSGDEVTLYYDPMIAKIIVWDETRAGALRRLAAAMEEVEVAGVRTNAAFLGRLASHPAFRAGEVDTGFIERHSADLVPQAEVPAVAIAIAAAAPYLGSGACKSSSAFAKGDGWRLLGMAAPEAPVTLKVGGTNATASLRFGAGHVAATVGDETVYVSTVETDGRLRAGSAADAMGPVPGRVVGHGEGIILVFRGASYDVAYEDPRDAADDAAGLGRAIAAPLTGKILSVHAKPGDRVRRGQALVVLEAMKMEHTLAAETDAVVAGVAAGPGDQVQDGQVIVTFADAE